MKYMNTNRIWLTKVNDTTMVWLRDWETETSLFNTTWHYTDAWYQTYMTVLMYYSELTWYQILACMLSTMMLGYGHACQGSWEWGEISQCKKWYTCNTIWYLIYHFVNIYCASDLSPFRITVDKFALSGIIVKATPWWIWSNNSISIRWGLIGMEIESVFKHVF